MVTTELVIIILLVVVLMGGLVMFAMKMKSGDRSSNIFDDLMNRSNPRSSLGSFGSYKNNGMFGGKGKINNILATVPTYGLLGFLFTFSLVAWSYMTNN